MVSKLRPAIVIFFFLALLTGIIYPLLVTGIAQVVFPNQANGSLIRKEGAMVGSSLIGQSFADPKYFWGRPSYTSPYPYNAAQSSGSNMAPSSAALKNSIQSRIEALHDSDPSNKEQIPIDLITSSGSGLDPDISVAAALYQAERVARVRNLDESVVLALIDKYTESRQFGFLGEPRVNVLLLNLGLDEIQSFYGRNLSTP
jgi:K+-transporting ATPase KdpC subunit